MVPVVYSPEGSIITPFSTVFEMSNAANVIAHDRKIEGSARYKPEYPYYRAHTPEQDHRLPGQILHEQKGSAQYSLCFGSHFGSHLPSTVAESEVFRIALRACTQKSNWIKNGGARIYVWVVKKSPEKSSARNTSFKKL